MAKQPLENPFQQQPRRERDTEMDAIKLDEKGTNNLGLGLRQGELDAVDLLVRRSGLNRNAIIRIAIRFFFTELREGRAKLEDYIKVKTDVEPKFPE